MTRPPRTRKKGGGDTTDKNHPACHVLLIEDDEGHVELIRRAFLKHKKEYRLTITGSLADARTIIDRDPPDLIIADWLLPDGKGIEILPTDRDAITIPVIIITSHGNEELAVEMLKAGVVDYIVKSESSFKGLPHIAEHALRDWGNIVQRKRAEEALRKSDEKFRNVFDWANDAILLHTLIVEGSPGRFIDVNQVACRMLGYSRDELLTMGPPDITPTELHSLLGEINRQAATKESVLFETRLLRKDGTTFPVESSDHLVTYEGKRIWLSHIRDITDRKGAEEALRVVQEKYTKAFLSAPDVITISELDSGRFVEVNEAATAIFGYSREELIGKSALELGIWLKKEDRDALIDQIREHGRVLQYEIVERRKSGELYTASLTADTITIGNLRYLITIMRDVTERKRMEDALRESEERYRILTDAAHDAIYTLSPEGVVTYVNSGGSALIGVPPEKIVGLSLESLFHPDIAQEFQEYLDKVISTKKLVRYDSKFWHENQNQVSWLDAQLVPQLGPDGSVVRVIGISRSITDRKEAEMLLKRFNEELEWQVRLRTAELEHTNTLLEAEIIHRTLAEENVRKSLNERELLLREIHHRVKNNLQIILSLISLQSRTIKDQKLLDTMGEFQNRIMAMAHIHERMCRAQDISRIDLSEIVTFLGSSLFKSYKVNPKVIRLNVELKDVQISIDSAIPISLIINELISNSIKHGFPKGTPGEITIAGRHEADTIVLSIKDTGIGIPKDLDWMRNKQSLGHRLVVSLVEQLNGTIELDRSVGTAFTIVMPEKIS